MKRLPLKPFLLTSLIAQALFIAPAYLYAQDGLLPTTQLKSQVDNEENLRRCINDATAGANMSFANAAKKDKCFIPLKFVCILFGHGEKSEPAWNTDGINFTRATQSCFSARTTTIKFAQNLAGTTDVAKGQQAVSATGASTAGAEVLIPELAGKDPNFDSRGKFIGKDGSSYYGLADGEITNRSLAGEDIMSILMNSPVAQKMSVKDREARFADPNKWGGVGNPSTAVVATNGAAPSGAGNGAGSGASAKTGSIEDLMAELGLNGEEGEEGKDKKDALADGEGEGEGGKSAAELLAKQESERLLARYSGNSRTIFQMVSSQYKRRSPNLLTLGFRVQMRNAEHMKEANRSPANLDKL